MWFHLLAFLSFASLSIAKSFIECSGKTFPRATNQCTSLIDSMAEIPWMQTSTTWGLFQTGDGRLPFTYNHSGCHLYLYFMSLDVREVDTFALRTYFPTMRMMDNECLKRGHEGTAFIGGTGIIKAFLIKDRHPLSIESHYTTSLNDTAGGGTLVRRVRNLPKTPTGSIAKPYINCLERTFDRSTTQCTVLIENLLSKRWTQLPTTFGVYRDGEGRLPFRYEHAGCVFELLLVGLNPHAEETFILETYTELMYMMDRECVRRGYVATTMVGSGTTVKAYMFMEGRSPYNATHSSGTTGRRTLPGTISGVPEVANSDAS